MVYVAWDSYFVKTLMGGDVCPFKQYPLKLVPNNLLLLVPIFARYLSSHEKGDCDEVEAADSSSKDPVFLAEVVQWEQLQIVLLLILGLPITNTKYN